MSLAPGSQLNEIRLLEQAGGTSTVWKAVDTRQPQALPIALKAVALSAGNESAALRRLSDELRPLSHPSLPRHLSLVEPAGQPLVGWVSEWIEGEPLSRLGRDPRMTEAHKLALLGHVTRALAHLHAAGVVHRDVRASNVLITSAFWASPDRPETVKLVDLAPLPLSQARGPARAGACAHVAPALLLQGSTHHQHTTPRDDLFGLGVLGWVLMSDAHPSGAAVDASSMPFMATYQAVLGKMLSWPVKGEVEGLWGDVLLACLEVDAAKRPLSAQAVADMLDGKTKVPSRPRRLLVAPSDDDEAPTTFKPSVIARHPSSPPPPVRTHAAARPAAIPDPLGSHTPLPSRIEITSHTAHTPPAITTHTGAFTHGTVSSRAPATLPQGQPLPHRTSLASKLLLWLGVPVGLALFVGLGVLLGLYLRGR